MPKESESKPGGKAAESKPAGRGQTGPQLDSAPPPVIPGSIHALPRQIQPRQMRALQRVAGNRYVQRSLAQNVIQRQGGGGNTTPIPPLPDMEARQALALDVLKRAYGSKIRKESKIVAVAGMAAMLSQYDQAMIRQGKTFVEDGNERPWAAGDAAKHPSIRNELAGFNDPSSGQIFIDTQKKPDEQTATLAHEMLHASSSGEVLGVLGRGVDEGITETLTQRAFQQAGYNAPGGFYASEMEFVGVLSSMFGENTVLFSYFTGVGPLRSMMDTTLDDEGAFDLFASQVRAKNWAWTDAFFRRYQQVRGGSELDKKVNAIVNRLGGWWVSDDDIAHVENIYHGSTPEEQVRLRYAIQARITSLSSHGQRARLRILIGF